MFSVNFEDTRKKKQKTKNQKKKKKKKKPKHFITMSGKILEIPVFFRSSGNVIQQIKNPRLQTV